MNALDLLQAAVISSYPSVAEVLAGTFTPPQDEVVLLVFRKDEWSAVGPFPTKEVDWKRLAKTDRIYVDP